MWTPHTLWSIGSIGHMRRIGSVGHSQVSEVTHMGFEEQWLYFRLQDLLRHFIVDLSHFASNVFPVFSFVVQRALILLILIHLLDFFKALSGQCRHFIVLLSLFRSWWRTCWQWCNCRLCRCCSWQLTDVLLAAFLLCLLHAQTIQQ